MNEKPVGLGLIGCGAFARFCLDAWSSLPGVRLAAVCDVRKDAADVFARDFGVPGHYNPAELICRDDVQVVHVATPPSSRYRLVMRAFREGKHVLCEKPLALTLDQADEMLAAASIQGLICPVNFVLRHNPVTEAVRAVIDSGVLGQVLSARLTNCAKDTPLPPDHWFWNRETSGGIFIEHGVHFFDLYRYWLGPGQVVSAQTLTREGTGQEDRATCVVRHEGGALVSHYHGFDQPTVLDRTDHRMVCELGDIRVDGWIPLTLTVDAAVEEGGLVRLLSCCQWTTHETVEEYPAEAGHVTSRGVARRLVRRVRLTLTPQSDKEAAYAASIRALLSDQLAFLRDGRHRRRVVERNGRDAQELAQAATDLADTERHEPRP